MALITLCHVWWKYILKIRQQLVSAHKTSPCIIYHLYSSLISLFKQFIYCDSLIKLYLKIAEATFRWMFNHSQLEKGDGLIIGASSVKQLNQNITMCAGAPLSDVIVNEFENLWQQTSHLCPTYKRWIRYSGVCVIWPLYNISRVANNPDPHLTF